MKNVEIYFEGNEITSIKCFKIDQLKESLAIRSNLEIIADVDSNLMDSLSGDMEGKVFEIKFGMTTIKFTCTEFGGMGVRVDERYNELIIFHNCYGNYTSEVKK